MQHSTVKEIWNRSKSVCWAGKAQWWQQEWSEEEEFFYTPITNSNMTSLNVKRETVLRNIDNNKMEPVTLRNVYNGSSSLYFLGNVIEPFPKNAKKFRKFRKQAVDGF